MSDLWAYNPSVCDGDFCPMNCDVCGKRWKSLEKELEMEEE